MKHGDNFLSIRDVFMASVAGFSKSGNVFDPLDGLVINPNACRDRVRCDLHLTCTTIKNFALNKVKSLSPLPLSLSLSLSLARSLALFLYL